MYLRQIHIENVRNLRQVRWSLPADQRATGWHVIVGDNGSGKSSFLRAVALGLVGRETGLQLRQAWEDWLSRGESSGAITLKLIRDLQDQFSGKGNSPTGSVEARLDFQRDEAGNVELESRKAAERHVWGKGEGWFSASYGPMRRFTGGDPEMKALFYQFPRLGRHLTLFEEKVALTECLGWLRDLRFKQMEGSPEGALLPRIQAFVNQADFLPFQARLAEVTSSAVRFVDGGGIELDVEQLSDGYRSVLSLTFDLIRQLVLVYGIEGVFDSVEPTQIIAPGVVLIDEIGAHLHPTWQCRIGTWFKQHFPRIQFLVTTHSPLVCQSAEGGSIFRLARPGFDEEPGMVSDSEFQRLVYGSVLDAYGTEIFGRNVTRSPQSRAMQDRLAELNVREYRDGLTPEELAELARLRQTLPTTAMRGANGVTSP